MEKHKEVFFTIRLHSAQSAASLQPIVDPDSLMPCELMDGRDAFLTMAREKHFEFSSLRRCKFSTMALLYELHTQGDKFIYTCNSCSKSVETRYHCTVCDDFDLCTSCYSSKGHNHRMERQGFDLGGDSQPTNKDTNGNPVSYLFGPFNQFTYWFLWIIPGSCDCHSALYQQSGACMSVPRRQL